MKLPSRILPTTTALLAALFCGCSTNGDANEAHASTEGHGEESGVQLALSERYDATRNGVRLTLAYDPDSNTFQGSVENTTERNLEQVRVEVHLSNSKELGPTVSADLAPGERRDVKLTATSTDFDRWTAHPEVGSGEHGHGEPGAEHGGEHRGEHDREGGSEHGREHD